MVTEELHGLGGLTDGLLADAACVAPLQRHVLPKEKAGLVGRVVELGAADVGVDAQQVEPRVLGQGDIACQLLLGRLAERHPSGALVGTLEEQALAVDRQHPLRHRHLAESGPEGTRVARGPVAVDDGNGDRLEGLVAETVGPPQAGLVDTDVPRHLVLAGGERLLDLVVEVADRRAQDHPRRFGRVEGGPQRQHGALVGGLRAHGDQAGDAHGPGLLDADRAPDATRVPVGVEAVPVLEHAGEVPFGGPVRGRRAADLDGEHVLGAGAQEITHLEGVGEEVALGVADVGAVEPDVAQIEEPVEDEPATPALFVRRLEVAPVEQRSVLAGEGRRRTPVPRHCQLGPVGVVEVGPGELPAQLLVGDVGPPSAREIHRRTLQI